MAALASGVIGHGLPPDRSSGAGGGKEIASLNFHPRTGTPTPGQELLPLKLRGTCSDRTPEGIRDPEMVQAPPM